MPSAANALPLLLPALLGYVLFANLLAFAAFWLDKRRAVQGGWRMPERNLLWLAALGGSAGAKAAQLRFRHKTRKEPFRSHLNWIIGLQAMLALALAVTLTGPPLRDRQWSAEGSGRAFGSATAAAPAESFRPQPRPAR